MNLQTVMQRLLSFKSAAGFTLAEVVVVTGILTLGGGLVGSGVYRALYTERSWRADVVATKELRHAESWFASDALNAKTTTLVDGGAPAESVTFTWTDTSSILHTAVYSRSGVTVVRTFDGASMDVARHVASAGFSRSGKVVTFDLQVTAENGSTESASLKTYLRLLP